ncbi:hypothetical protein BB558_002326 [Smittium angustum]|uniref:Uncharacterized protein n=1 Tax=Smittium angustum TaxID=133377 RepID=A0A2U1J959_SMIAN|nr:hypothetical protein BB558_002326 [Smittium angustum]
MKFLSLGVILSIAGIVVADGDGFGRGSGASNNWNKGSSGGHGNDDRHGKGGGHGNDDRHGKGGWNNNRGRRGRGWGGVAYIRGGRKWYWNNQCDVIFVRALVYRPVVWFDQRFQFCYQYMPNFKVRWNSDSLFRRRWNSDSNFRDQCFNSVYN